MKFKFIDDHLCFESRICSCLAHLLAVRCTSKDAKKKARLLLIYSWWLISNIVQVIVFLLFSSRSAPDAIQWSTWWLLSSRFKQWFLSMHGKSLNLHELFIYSLTVKQWIKLPEPRNRIFRHHCLWLSFTTQIDRYSSIIASYKLVIFHQNLHQFEILLTETDRCTTHNVNSLSQHEWHVVANG